MGRHDTKHNHARKVPSDRSTKEYYLAIVSRAITNDKRHIEYVGDRACGKVACDACCGRVPYPTWATHLIRNAHGAGWSAKLCARCAATVAKMARVEIINDLYQRDTGSDIGRPVHLPRSSRFST